MTAAGCGPACWEPVRCPEHHILMAPGGRSAPDLFPTCGHEQRSVFNPRHLWDEHDSDRAYFDRPGWEQHVDGCQECRHDYRGEDPEGQR